NRVCRFNRALARERLPAPHEAADDWREFLARELPGGWAVEARAHLDHLEELLRKQRGASDDSGSDLRPAVLLASIVREHADAKAVAQRMIVEHDDLWVRDIAATTPGAAELLLRSDQLNAQGESDDARAAAAQAESNWRGANPSGGVLAAYEQAYSL